MLSRHVIVVMMVMIVMMDVLNTLRGTIGMIMGMMCMFMAVRIGLGIPLLISLNTVFWSH